LPTGGNEVALYPQIKDSFSLAIDAAAPHSQRRQQASVAGFEPQCFGHMIQRLLLFGQGLPRFVE